ncbi:MAG: methylenetetrahydrofolate reductase [Haliangiales bacterium]
MNEPRKRLQNTLESDSFLLSAELTPPRGIDLSEMLGHARAVAPYVDVVQINDSLLARARCSTLVAAMKVDELGVEPVLQFSLRHRNRIQVQNDLLGIAAVGLRNLIVLGGYPIHIGSDPEALDATDIRGPDAIRAVSRFATEGRMFNGDSLDARPDLFIGSIEIPCMEERDIPASIDKLTARIDAGARFIQVQAIFDMEPMRAWMAAVRDAGLHERAHFIAAVFPFSGAERLRFLQKVPGLCIPEHVFRRIERERDGSESLRYTVELIDGIRAIPGIKGLHLRSISAESWVPRILSEAGLTPGSTAPERARVSEVGAPAAAPR